MHKRSIIAALLGHVMERYDVALYGYFAVMLAPIFFPTNDKSISIIASFGAVSAGYLMRPLGGMIFGHLGDLYGRKKAFVLSMCVIIVPTFIIGILPAYKYIGVWAPVTLVACRLIQGLCNGGEFSGAGIFIGEHLPDSRLGLGGGLVCAGGLLGAAIGTMLGMGATFFGCYEWFWRIPFILGAVVTAVTCKFRTSMLDPPVFQKILDEHSTVRFPLLQVFKRYKVNILCALVIGGFGHVLLYTTTFYMNVVYSDLSASPFTIMSINTVILLWWILLAPMVGVIADKIGVITLMLYGSSFAIVFSLPFFYYLTYHSSVYQAFIAQAIFSLIGVSFVAPISSLFTLFFPIRERYSGVAFSVTLGQALLGGTTPLIEVLLARSFGNIAPAYFVISCGFLSFFALLRTRRFKYHN